MLETNNITEIDAEECEIKNESETDDNKHSTYYIYKYTNTKNNKIYIGLCKNPDRRQISHKSAAQNDSNACPLFYRAIRKHGYEPFQFEILEIVNGPKAADDREIFWIKTLNARDNKIGYNISPGGGGRGNPNNTDTHKQCADCKQIKVRYDFYNIVTSPDGKSYYCKMCDCLHQKEKRLNMTKDDIELANEKRREAYQNDPEARKRIIEESTKYYNENKEKVSERKKQFYQDNIEKFQEQNREAYVENQEKRKDYAKQDRVRIKENNLKLTIPEILEKTPIKHCKACSLDKDSDKFYIDLTRLDALSRICKECTKEKGRLNRLKKLKQILP